MSPSERVLEVLLIEDSPGDVRVTREVLRDAGLPVNLHVANDGVEAMAFLKREGDHANAPRPDFILLDLNLPKMDGREVLVLIKQDEELKTIPTVVLTTSAADADVLRSYQLQANAFLTKPVQPDAFESLVLSISDFWLTRARLPLRSGSKTMRPGTRLLLVEDNPGDARLLREMLNEPGADPIAVIHVESMREAEELLAAGGIEIILLDLGLPDAQGLGAVRRAVAAAPRIPLVVLTGMDDQLLAKQALKEGAEDYLIKGQIETRGLSRGLRYAIERKAMEEALFVEKERAEVTLNSIGDAVISSDVSGNVTYLNLAAEKMTGWPLWEALGRPLAEVFVGVDALSRETTPISADGQNRTADLLSNGILIGRNHLEVPMEASISPIRDRTGQFTGAVIVFRDVSAARAMADQVTHASEHDFLTGLPNRLLLNDRISQAIALAPRHTKQVAVLFLDLDGFKHINDSLGHGVGDKLLQSVADRLVACVRASDTVSRQGGDEFVILLSAAEQWEDAVIVAKRILDAVAEPHSIDHHKLHVTASIGVSVFPDDGGDAETLIKNADTAMYQAKENGRQSYQFFKPAMNVRAVERQTIEEGLRDALERREFVLHYQPKINLRTGAITGAEALIRWTHPVRGMVSPAQFIPIAEESGLIRPIGLWVLREACLQARAWIDAGLPSISMAVNVSAVELRGEGFLEKCLATLYETGMDPSSLELELTESVLLTHAEPAAEILQTLREQGVGVAIDDFGTGYSSLSYLSRFPIDALKVDRSFVSQITAAGGQDSTIVTAVISLAQSLNLRVVAEGVETSEQLQFLQAHECDEAQGFLFSRPVPPDQFARLLETGISREEFSLTSQSPPLRGRSHQEPAHVTDLEHSLAAKDRFLAGISHELRTPLTVVVGMVDILAGRLDDFSEENQSLIQDIRSSAQELASLVEDHLTSARLSAGALTVEHESVDLDLVVARAMLMTNRPARLSVLIGKLGTCTGDAIRIRQIVRNLIRNAYRYAVSNIEIQANTAGTAGLEILNDGTPVPEHLVKTLFEPFVGGSRPGQPEPIGLGLSVSRQLARRMGGDLSYSFVDGEVRFRLSLPPARSGPPVAGYKDAILVS